MATSMVGHLALFNQHCQQTDKSIEWKYCDLPEGTKTTPVWTVDAYVDGEFVGTGRGNTKKAARNDAAKQGLKYLGVVVVSNIRLSVELALTSPPSCSCEMGHNTLIVHSLNVSCSLKDVYSLSELSMFCDPSHRGQGSCLHGHDENMRTTVFTRLY